jgi:hypothetical protein
MSKKPINANGSGRKSHRGKTPSTRRPVRKRVLEWRSESECESTAATLREELQEARAELARLALGENLARRRLQDESSTACSVEQRLREELEALHVDLRTAQAELEIAHAGRLRAVLKADSVANAAQAALEAERLASHASDHVRDRMLTLRGEIDRLRHENDSLRHKLTTAEHELRQMKESTG